MSGDVHVRFSEGLGVKFPRATRLVMCFAHENDARRVLAVLDKRFARFGLTVHPEKTQLVQFRKPIRTTTDRRGPGRGVPGSFTLLGFTHYWAKSRKGYWVVKRKTASSRLTRAIVTIARWCRLHRHEPIAEQHAMLSRKLRGHFAYYGITGNARSLSLFHLAAKRCWRKWLGRRHRCGALDWASFRRLLARYPLPPPLVLRSVYRSVANP